MRYINRDVLIPTIQTLIDAAERARTEVLAEADAARRHDLIDRHREKWVAFRVPFESLSHGKCWYTESQNPGTDDDIDHFRPKGSLAEDETQGGYWWEALNWRNFRLSCHRANRLRQNPGTGKTYGKGDHFPLLNPANRARTPADDLAREHPSLLDPTDPFDPPLLSFNIDGTIDLSPEFAGNQDAEKRIEASRIYLHLDWPQIAEQRLALYQSISIKVTDGEGFSTRASAGDVGSREALKATVRDLIGMTEKQRPYSMAAKAYISTFRHITWIKVAVLPNCI
jgi:uncharacterized protein (TIGR02646 family)